MPYPGFVSRFQYLVYALRARAFAGVQSKPRDGDILVFDPALVGYQGHHAEFARLLKAEANLIKRRVSFYAHFRADTTLLLELKALPLFWDSGYVTSNDFLAVYEEQTRSLVASLSRIRVKDIHRETWILIHTATVYQSLGRMSAGCS